MHVQGGSIKEHLRTHQIHINRSLIQLSRKVLSFFNCARIPIKVNKKVGTSKFVSTTVDGHPTISDSVAVQSLQNNASRQAFHDDDIKGTSNKDSALTHKTCEFVEKTGDISDIVVDGFVPGVNFDVIHWSCFVCSPERQCFHHHQEKKVKYCNCNCCLMLHFRIDLQHLSFMLYFRFICHYLCICVIKYLTFVYKF